MIAKFPGVLCAKCEKMKQEHVSIVVKHDCVYNICMDCLSDARLNFTDVGGFVAIMNPYMRVKSWCPECKEKVLQPHKHERDASCS